MQNKVMARKQLFFMVTPFDAFVSEKSHRTARNLVAKHTQDGNKTVNNCVAEHLRTLITQ